MSLRFRIAAWYGGLTGVVVFLICLYSYALHSRTHYDAIDDMLQRDALHIATEWTASRTVSEREHTLDAAVLLGASARLYDTSGAVVHEAAAPGSGAPLLDPRRVLAGGAAPAYPAIAALIPSTRRTSAGAGAFAVLYGPEGMRWRAYVLPLASRTEFFVATMALQEIDAAVERFGRLMLACALLASVATFFAGWRVARHALRPVAVLTAGAIAQSRGSSRRLTPVGTQDELARLAATFHELLGSQEDVVDAQQRFITAASHELRAPLTVVLANLELLERREASMNDAERRQALGEAHVEATRMARMIADLLSLARADAGIPLRREQVELDRIVLDVIGELRHEVHGQRVAVAAFEPATVVGDPDRLKQLVLILVENAIKYTGDGGRVDVSLRKTSGGVTIEVSDTGVGIAPDDLARVFERFYRVDPARSRNAGGTGLGLSIARWIAEEHGGTVELASTLGKGTTARIRLPTG